MTKPSSHYTEANGLRLHYLESGTADPSVTPILLLHGFPTSSHLYRNILPELGKTRRAIAIDLPGYGLSDKPLDVAYDYDFYSDTLSAFVDALGIQQTHLVVHDLGGPAGLYWATRHSGRVRSIVVLNTLVFPEVHWTVTAFLLALRTPGLRDFLVSPKGIVATMKLGVVHKERMNRATLTPYTAPFETKPARKALIQAGSGLGIGGLARIAEKLPSLEAPLRLIYGEKDRILPDVAKTMRRIQELRPEAELTALPDCGHFLQEDEPGRVAELIVDFADAQSSKYGGPETQSPESDAVAAASVVRAFNGWARNSLDVTPATVTHCSLDALPDDPRDLMRLLHPSHTPFFDQAAGPNYETLTFAPTQISDSFDPTAEMLPDASETLEGRRAQSTAHAYFRSRAIHFTQATGTDNAADLRITFQIALDPEASLLFTFINGLSG